MSKQIKTLLTVGILVIVIPILGIPSSWKSFFLAICGLVVVGVALSIHRGPGMEMFKADRGKSSNKASERVVSKEDEMTNEEQQMGESA